MRTFIVLFLWFIMNGLSQHFNIKELNELAFINKGGMVLFLSVFVCAIQDMRELFKS